MPKKKKKYIYETPITMEQIDKAIEEVKKSKRPTYILYDGKNFYSSNLFQK